MVPKQFHASRRQVKIKTGQSALTPFFFKRFFNVIIL